MHKIWGAHYLYIHYIICINVFANLYMLYIGRTSRVLYYDVTECTLFEIGGYLYIDLYNIQFWLALAHLFAQMLG